MPSTLICGGGLAGLFTALKLAPAPCTVLSPAPLGQGASSAWAQGGVSAAIQPGDSVASHVDDTIVAGAGLVDEGIAQGMAAEASDRIHDLLDYGVPFDRDLEGKLVASREAAHTHARVVRVRGDQAGAKIMEALVASVRKTPSIQVIEGAEALELLVEGGKIAGARVAHEGRMRLIRADNVILATGGIGHLYQVTTNPPQACGQGLGMAALAGAEIRDPEFVQFHPTALNVGGDPAPLVTEALRGEGAILINDAGERFMFQHHPDGELAPRDVVARGVFAEIKAGRGAWIDAREAVGAAFAEKFPTVYAAAKRAGFDPVTQPLPVCPAQHYHMGGVLTDNMGRTSIEGLYAVGEVSSTGVHGANRLASNSLLEATVFPARVAALLSPRITHAPSFEDGYDEALTGDTTDVSAIEALRPVMQNDAGVLRDAAGLTRALGVIQTMQRQPQTIAARNALVAAELIAGAALLRQESRGGHARTDFSATADVAQHSVFTLAGLRERLATPS